MHPPALLRACVCLGMLQINREESMPRPCQRVRLESGLKLDINRLARRKFIQPGMVTGPVGIEWKNTYFNEITSGIITADLSGTVTGWFRIQIGQLDQWISLVAFPRHFGGRQWYFVCPYMNRRVSVLWMPPGASSFGSRQRWGRQVAYVSQFLDRDNRAHRGKAKINARLCAIGNLLGRMVFSAEAEMDEVADVQSRR
jgi:hypothetical protein